MHMRRRLNVDAVGVICYGGTVGPVSPKYLRFIVTLIIHVFGLSILENHELETKTHVHK